MRLQKARRARRVKRRLRRKKLKQKVKGAVWDAFKKSWNSVFFKKNET